MSTFNTPSTASVASDYATLYGAVVAAHVSATASQEEVREAADEAREDLTVFLIGLPDDEKAKIKNQFESDVENLTGYRPSFSPSPDEVEGAPA